jgi:hypothetical protein
MARRSALPPEEREAEIRRKAAVRQRNKRSRDRHVTTNESHVTEPAGNGAAHVTPLQTSPVGGNSLNGGEARGVEAILVPFEARGYRHDPRFWAKLAQTYPALDLELEALKLADWLTEPKNAKRRCSKAFLDHWLAKASADCMAPVPNAPYHQPHTQQGRNPGPPDLPTLPAPLEVIRPAELEHYRAERSRETLADKVARLKGGAG